MRRLKHLAMMGIIVTLLIYGVFTLQDVYHSYTKSKQYAQLELQNAYQDSEEFEELVKKMTEDEVGFVFWNKKKDASIMNKEFGRAETVAALGVKGNTGCIYPDCNGLTVEDEGSCLIDKSTAVKLFGSSDVIGEQIQYQDQSYVIQGILQQEKGVFVYEPIENQKIGNQTTFDHLALKAQDGFKAADMVRQIQNLYGIQ